MDTLLAFNEDIAFLGDVEGRVRKEARPAELSPKDWENQLHSDYLEPEHWYKDEEGVSFARLAGSYSYNKDGQLRLHTADGFKPYTVFSDEASGLSVRAAFLSTTGEWFVADRESDSEDELNE